MARVLIALALAATALGCAARDDDAARGRAGADAAGNYRVLTSAQSKRLLAFAVDVRACLAEQRVQLSAPRPVRTRITLATEVAPKAVVQAMVACESEVGVPPVGSSLQARPGMVVLYLPKQCLLDPKVGA